MAAGVHRAAGFPTTHWSLIRKAGQPQTYESREAFAALSQAYWSPVYAYLRRLGCSADDAQDLVQDFFVHLLKKFLLQRAGPERGPQICVRRAPVGLAQRRERLARLRRLPRAGLDDEAPVCGGEVARSITAERQHVTSDPPPATFTSVFRDTSLSTNVSRYRLCMAAFTSGKDTIRIRSTGENRPWIPKSA